MLLRLLLGVLPALFLGGVTVARADVLTLNLAAVIGAGNSIDAEDVFNEGFGADLAGQAFAVSIGIDTSALTSVCGSGGGCYGDFGAGAISVGFTLNGVTSTTVSTGTMGYFGGRSGGQVSIGDPMDGGYNYLSIGAASADGMVRQSIGVMFDAATLFSAYGGDAADPDPVAAVESLRAIAGGAGLVAGGITFLSPVEHLDATVTGISVPEPGALAVFAIGLVGLRVGRWRARGR